MAKRFGNSIGIQFILVPAGKFSMGSPETEEERAEDEGPRHEVQISKSFYLGAHEVTQKQYARIMGADPAHFHGQNGGSLKHPVEQVSWEEAVEFCRRLSQQPLEKRTGRVYRLRTEAEWEYACRAGGSFPFQYGASLASLLANFDGNVPYGDGDLGPFHEKTFKIGSYYLNDFG